MTYGYLDTRFIDLPPNIDLAYLRGLTTARGISFAALLRQLDSRLAAINSTADPLVAQLIHYTSDITSDQTQPTAFILNEENEYGLPRPQLAEGQGVALPLRRWVESMAFTEDYLEQATQATILNQFDSVALGFTRGALIQVLKRLTDNAEIRVDRGTAMTNPGFAGSGTGSNVFGGTFPDGSPVPGGYTLYFRDTAANLATVIKAARDALARWWAPPFDMIGSVAQISAVTALPDFVRAPSPLVNPAAGVATANVDAATYVGVYDGNVMVQNGRLEFGSSPNLTIFKDFGNFNSASPLAWRFDEAFGRGVVIRSRELYPLDQAVMRQRFGIGVANRTAAANITIAASGNYVPPVIA